jgi:hypothetical protein
MRVLDGARVLGDPGSVLVVDDAQLERVEIVQTDDVGGRGCVHWLAMHGVVYSTSILQGRYRQAYHVVVYANSQ